MVLYFCYTYFKPWLGLLFGPMGQRVALLQNTVCYIIVQWSQRDISTNMAPFVQTVSFQYYTKFQTTVNVRLMLLLRFILLTSPAQQKTHINNFIIEVSNINARIKLYGDI